MINARALYSYLREADCLRAKIRVFRVLNNDEEHQPDLQSTRIVDLLQCMFVIFLFEDTCYQIRVFVASLATVIILGLLYKEGCKMLENTE